MDVNLATFLDPSYIGQPAGPGPTDDTAAWQAYLKAMRDSTVASWNRAQRSYVALKRIRSDLGLPLVVPTTEATMSGALSPQTEADIVNLGSMITVATKFADEALANKRRVLYAGDGVGLAIEALPSDSYVIGTANGGYALVGRDGKPVAITGTTVESIGQLGIAPIVWVAGAAVAIAVVVSAYFAFDAACERSIAETRQAALQTIETHSKELIESGKSTPEQEQKRIAAVYAGAAQVTEAEAQAKQAPKSTTSLERTIVTVAYVGLGIAAIYLAAQIIPSFAPRREAVA